MEGQLEVKFVVELGLGFRVSIGEHRGDRSELGNHLTERCLVELASGGGGDELVFCGQLGASQLFEAWPEHVGGGTGLDRLHPAFPDGCAAGQNRTLGGCIQRVGTPVAPGTLHQGWFHNRHEGSRRTLRDVDMPRTRYAVASGGVNVAYQVLGHGPADLVCVPSAGSHLEVFWEEPAVARYLSRLASFSRLILFDKRGVGMSDRIEGVPTVEERMDDVRAVMDAVDSPRAALVGMSEGGAIGAVFAATYPERVSSLVLLGAAIRCWMSPDIDLDDPEVIAFLDEHFGEGGFVFMGAPSVAQDDRIRAWGARVERMGMTPTSSRALLRMNTSFDVRSVLSAVTTPTLVIHRTGDLVVGVDQGREAAELIPGARYVELAGDDHLPYFDDPDTTLGLIEEFVTGERHPVEADRVLATVVFTDIVNSTEHASRIGDRNWREALDSYDLSVDRELERYRGRLVKSTGDGTLATFDGPGRAIQWARSIRAVTHGLGFDIRAGLHTGEIELRGTDIAGLAVVIANRVSAKAGPGEILVSSTVKDLVAGSSIEFFDRADHELKGVPGAWHLFAVAS